MMTKRILPNGLFGLGLLLAGALYAQRPVENIDPHRHPNLAECQHHLQQAWSKADEAQRENKDELGGHASKAKEHIEAADRKLKEAAEFADHRRLGPRLPPTGAGNPSKTTRMVTLTGPGNFE